MVEAIEIKDSNADCFIYEDAFDTYTEALEFIGNCAEQEENVNYGYQIQKYYINNQRLPYRVVFLMLLTKWCQFGIISEK